LHRVSHKPIPFLSLLLRSLAFSYHRLLARITKG
jgi:hypothetical protein